MIRVYWTGGGVGTPPLLPAPPFSPGMSHSISFIVAAKGVTALYNTAVFGNRFGKIIVKALFPKCAEAQLPKCVFREAGLSTAGYDMAWHAMQSDLKE